MGENGGKCTFELCIHCIKMWILLRIIATDHGIALAFDRLHNVCVVFILDGKVFAHILFSRGELPRAERPVAH